MVPKDQDPTEDDRKQHHRIERAGISYFRNRRSPLRERVKLIKLHSTFPYSALPPLPVVDKLFLTIGRSEAWHRTLQTPILHLLEVRSVARCRSPDVIALPHPPFPPNFRSVRTSERLRAASAALDLKRYSLPLRRYKRFLERNCTVIRYVEPVFDFSARV